jgi:transposase
VIQVTAQTRILVAVEPADFRLGIDGLSRLCQEKLKEDAFSGCVFVFRNRRATSVKILTYDGQGFWLCHKRLSAGRFRFWPAATLKSARPLEPHELGVLLACGNPIAAKGTPLWRRVKPGALS